MSTYEGEKTIPKNEISSVYYDLIEQNLLKLGDSHMKRREFEKAYFYYDKARKANPDFQPARDRMNYVTGYLFRRREQEKRDVIKRRGEFEKWPHGNEDPKKYKNNPAKDIWDLFGLKISENKGYIEVEGVQKFSSAYSAGIEQGDKLVSVWGHLAGYMSADAAASLILKESVGEIKIVIERDVNLKKEKPFVKSYQDILGGKLDMLLDGLTLVEVNSGGPADKAGLKKDDLITAIDGSSTRYMPINDAINIIENRNNESVLFTIQRRMTMWRK
jgi:C-terminal processing protease CtpA/Prc